MKTITSKTPDFPKEFDITGVITGTINAHFSFIKKKGNRIAYLRTEKSSGITSIEVIEPIKRQHPRTGETYYAYPSAEQFGTYGAYISVRDEAKRNELMEFYLDNGFIPRKHK